MRLTRFGLKAVVFYTMLVAAFYAAPYLNLFFMLLAFASVLGCSSIFWAIRNVAGIRGHLADPAPIQAGALQSAHLVLQVRRRQRFSLSASMVIRGERAQISGQFDLPASAAQRIPIELPPLSRGIHPVSLVRIESIYPLGILQCRRPVDAPGELVVYPRPLDLAPLRDRSGANGCGALGGTFATEMGPAGLRDYRDGDELRDVHWKATARRGELVIREMEADAAPGLEAVLDLRTEAMAFENALSLATALALECQTNKELFTLHTQDHGGTYGEGHQDLDGLLAYLAAVQPLPADAAAPPAVAPGVLRLPLASPLASPLATNNTATPAHQAAPS